MSEVTVDTFTLYSSIEMVSLHRLLTGCLFTFLVASDGRCLASPTTTRGSPQRGDLEVRSVISQHQIDARDNPQGRCECNDRKADCGGHKMQGLVAISEMVNNVWQCYCQCQWSKFYDEHGPRGL
ncbi:hypothetical protein PG985_007815 [Apiospora marii]|uniref:uncharacterized protein n=1 Tax=Apiospora marii TaxID=335849 RepID=UPI00313245D9